MKPGKSFSNGNGPGHGATNSGPQGPATIIITGTRLGAGDTHWWWLI